MSIASEITRLQSAKADLKTAIEGKGVTVPSASLLDDYADLVDDIQTGGSGYTLDQVGGTIVVSGLPINTDISGAIDITVFATRMWAFTETSITSAVIHTTGSVSGYGIRERTFSACRQLADVLYFPASSTSGIGTYAFQNCPALERVRIAGTLGENYLAGNTFNSCANLTDIYVPWAEGAVKNAPWSATNATVHYNTVFDSNGNIVE